MSLRYWEFFKHESRAATLQCASSDGDKGRLHNAQKITELVRTFFFRTIPPKQAMFRVRVPRMSRVRGSLRAESRSRLPNLWQGSTRWTPSESLFERADYGIALRDVGQTIMVAGASASMDHHS